MPLLGLRVGLVSKRASLTVSHICMEEPGHHHLRGSPVWVGHVQMFEWPSWNARSFVKVTDEQKRHPACPVVVGVAVDPGIAQ